MSLDAQKEMSKKSTKSVWIAVLNDIHYDPFYDPKVGKDKFCRSTSPFGDTEWIVTRMLDDEIIEAWYGRFGCDPNGALIDLMTKKL